MPFVLIAILALPLIEIAVLIMVGSTIGVFATIGLIILTGILGLVLLRVQGFSVLTRIRSEMERGQIPDKSLADAAMITIAGIFLMIPGFVSDVIGILLFLPPVRALILSMIGKRVTVVRPGRWQNSAQGPDIVELDPGDFRRNDVSPDTSSPWRLPPKTGR
ncbi:MAG: FxsA family protein [Rhizobiaceae bacterium]